ncbi:MAG: neutral/alkaline non-lysosomal ceramidase N-terminal domain-containing protein, partial [Verrucomicrobiota bacterium]|nr:neutral/alkaline non-lysosomal ceramidase N-terminal domain-containing protein [Verrucomicrobiota bacterium]
MKNVLNLFTCCAIIFTLWNSSEIFGQSLDSQKPKIYSVGAAKIDITPDYPIRLNGYFARTNESEGIIQHLFAKALAIGTDKENPAVLISLDNCIIPGDLRDQLLNRLAKRGIVSEKFAICTSHTHSAPKLTKAADNIFGKDLSSEEQAHIDRYTKELIDKMEQVAQAALKNRRPSKLFWSKTKADFAVNRRTKDGPVDHDLPVLKITDQDGKIRALLVNYACHCTTLGPEPNQICGDWAGYAQEYLEQNFPGAIALTVIGCGADANPSSRPGVNFAKQHGQSITSAVGELLKKNLTPLHGKLEGRLKKIQLPFDTLPTRAEWEEKGKKNDPAGYQARKNLARLDRGEKLPTEIPYLVQTWNFGDELAMVFLSGEVVVDYSLRLKKEFDAARLWINAYANDVPCYIPSKRILQEGGYEGGGAMVYYDLPAKLGPDTEEKIVGAVHELIPKNFIFDEHKAEFPPPQSPAEALRSFHLKSDFTIDLAAAEPLIVDPVAIDFGTDGKLWVVEMHDYPTGLDGKDKPGGRIKLLEDKNGDGKFDTSTLFLDGLSFPTGLMQWRKGVLICAAPDILYAEDTNGDGKADIVKKL